MKVELITATCQWEANRVNRLTLENAFNHFTGHIDIVELHVPYTKYEYVFKMMAKTRKLKGKKVLILAGDSLNLDMLSRFYQRSDDRSKPSDEWRDLVIVMREAKRTYDKIIMEQTNHDSRIYKCIRDNILGRDRDDEIQEWLRTYQEAFEREGIENIMVIKGAIFQVGQIIITHFENNSIVPGNIPRDVIKYLVPRIQKPWSIVFQAHTHTQSKIPNDRKICIETGALCKTLDYWRRGRMQGKGKLTSLGYAVCDMKDGIPDPNESNFVFCEWEDYI